MKLSHQMCVCKYQRSTMRNLCTQTFTQKNLCTEGPLNGVFFIIEKPLHGETFTHSRVYTEKLLHKQFFTQMIFTHKRVCTEKLFHTETVAHRSFYRDNFLHKKNAQRNLYAKKPLHRDIFTHRRVYKENLLHKDIFTQPLHRIHFVMLQNHSFTSVFAV